MGKNILVIGSLNMDLVVGVPYMPAPGETIIGHSFERIPGGKGANQAFTIAKLGGRASMVGAVGADGFGDLLVENLRDVGVDTTPIYRHPSALTGVALINVDDQGQNNIIVIQGANAMCDVAYIEERQQDIIDSDFVIIQMEIPHIAVYRAIELASRHRKTIVLNPAPAPDHIPQEIYEKISYIIPNETEIKQLTGIAADSIEHAELAAKTLLAKGVKNVIVTLGSQGALLVHAAETVHVPAPIVPVVDTTAAGDSFVSAFVLALSEGQPVKEAMTFAQKVSTYVVTKKGAQTSIPSRQEIGF